jgi:hypothetical protein
MADFEEPAQPLTQEAPPREALVGDRLVSGLTKSDLDSWLALMVVESDDPERVRRSKTAPIAFFR